MYPYPVLDSNETLSTVSHLNFNSESVSNIFINLIAFVIVYMYVIM